MVLLMRGEKSGEQKTAVVWTNRKGLWIVESPSQRHAQAFYAQNYSRPAKPRVEDMQLERLYAGVASVDGAIQAKVECFQFEDGIVVKRTTADFSSVGLAQAEIRTLISEAQRELDRRHPKGEGAAWLVLRMAASRPREGRIVVVRDFGRRILIQESSSIRHARGLTDSLLDSKLKAVQ
ncbi:MAG: hypothetical protein ACRD4D_03960 [Candidatus Acidiferrales bacterium]